MEISSEAWVLSGLGGLGSSVTWVTASATALTWLVYVYFTCPHLLVQMYFRIIVRWSGMRLKTLTDHKGFTFTFGERGQKVKGRPSILALHGFSADHFMWAPIALHLPPDVHFVALDLPGHGFTSDPTDGEDIGFAGQLKRIRQFVRLSGLESEAFHVMGVSMGGALSGVFAAHHPDLVSGVTMCCPSMKTPEDSVMFTQNRKLYEENGGRLTLESCPLLPQTGAGLMDMLHAVSYCPGYVPRQILQGAVNLRKQRNQFYLSLVHCLLSEHGQTYLQSHLGDVTCPVQVLWGLQDQVVHVSGVSVLRAGLPDLRRVDLMPRCGHAVNLDQPKLFAQHVARFYAQLYSQQESTLNPAH